MARRRQIVIPAHIDIPEKGYGRGSADLTMYPLKWSKSLANPLTFFPRVYQSQETHATPTAYLIVPKCNSARGAHSIQVQCLRQASLGLLKIPANRGNCPNPAERLLRSSYLEHTHHITLYSAYREEDAIVG